MKFILIYLFLAYGFYQPTFCDIRLSGTAPVTKINNSLNFPVNIGIEEKERMINAVEKELNNLLDSSFNATIDQANQNLSKFKNQKDLAMGMSNANAYTIHSGSFTGYQNYKYFALGTGFMVGVQAPSLDVGYYGKVQEEISESGDVFAGVGFGFSILNIGLHAKFILPGLYLNTKFGKFKKFYEGTTYDFLTYGIGVNYALIKAVNVVGLVKWRGLSLGTGYYRQSNKFSMEVTTKPIKQKVPFREKIIDQGDDDIEKSTYGSVADQLGFTHSHPGGTMTLTPNFDLDLDINTTTIPFDITTSVGFLLDMLNINVGTGVDLNFGKTDIALVGKSTVSTTVDNPNPKMEFSQSQVTFRGSSDNGPALTRMRFMAGAGVGLGPIQFSFQSTYYLMSGISFGFTGVIVW